MSMYVSLPLLPPLSPVLLVITSLLVDRRERVSFSDTLRRCLLFQ
jgi:hypothetical protein